VIRVIPAGKTEEEPVATNNECGGGIIGLAPAGANVDTLVRLAASGRSDERRGDILPRLKSRASHPVLAEQVNPKDWESKVCWTVSRWLCHEAVTRPP
jgi:hypothetical protein